MTSSRRKQMESHIRMDDYFSTLATVLDLLRQEMEKSKTKNGKHCVLLKQLIADLVYLQERYKIIEKYK